MMACVLQCVDDAYWLTCRLAERCWLERGGVEGGGVVALVPCDNTLSLQTLTILPFIHHPDGGRGGRENRKCVCGLAGTTVSAREEGEYK